MSAPLHLLDPKKTKEEFPDNKIHGEIVLAFDERHKDYVEVSPKIVQEMPKVYRFWLEDRRRESRAFEQQDRRRPNGKSK